MKKGLLTSIICFSSLVFSSCGSKYIKVTILECSHCSFENVTKARVGKDLVIQAYVDRGYELDDKSDSLEIIAGDLHVPTEQYSFDKSNNKLTISSQCFHLGDLSIKGTADLKESTFTLIVPKSCYKNITSYNEQIDIERVGGIQFNVEPLEGKTLKKEISVIPSNVVYTYDTSSSVYKFKIEPSELYQDITVELPNLD